MAETKIYSKTDKIIDYIFAKSNFKYILLIVIFGAILRFLVASNISALGDEMVHGPHAINFLNSGLMSSLVHSPVWFYLTDLGFKILGVTLFSTRFLSFFFGTLSIFLVYMIALKMFSRKTALLSAFLLAVSYFTLRYTLVEMDLSALFFLLSAIYYFIVDAEKNKFPYFSCILIGISALIKTPSLFYVPAFLIAFFLFYKNKDTKIKFKEIIIFGVIILAIYSPIIIHNYLWYQDKGMVDVYFAQYFDIAKAREAYVGIAGYDSGLLFSTFFEGIYSMSKLVFVMDPLIFIIGILGFALSFKLKEKRKIWYFLLAFEISGFVFLLLSSWLPTHYVSLIPVLCIFGAYLLEDLLSRIKMFDSKKVLFSALAVIFLFQLFIPPIGDTSHLLQHLTSKSSLAQLRDYSNIMDKNSIVIVDSRIYRGRIAWAFSDFHYLESAYLSELLSMNQNLSYSQYAYKVYFVECALDDCGWGTIASQPELNLSSEQIAGMFASSTNLEKIIYAGGGYEEKTGAEAYKIYQGKMNLNPQLISTIDSTHEWFYYPVNYVPKEKSFDYYQVHGFFNHLIYYLAWLIVILAIIFSIIIPFVVIYRAYKDSKD